MMAIPTVDLRSDSKGQPGNRGTGEAPAADYQDDLDYSEPWFICRQCGRRITRSDARRAVHGQHRHVFANPNGIVFEIACFSAAQGFSYTGNPSTDFSWFPGYTWRIILCAGCHIHLGWMFSAHSGGIFFGLITDRLILESSDSS